MDYKDVQQMLGLPDIMSVKSMMVVEPHPDDNEVGAGATIKQLCDRGCSVLYVTVTDGRAGSEDPNVTPELITPMRMRERHAANQILGVQESYNLGFEDGGTWTENEAMVALIPLVRQFRPEVVMTIDAWTPYESHPDHIKTGKAVGAALLYAKNGIVLKGQGQPYDVPQIAFYGSAYPNYFVDVSQTWTAKLEALRAHRSQFDTPSWPLLSGFLTAEAERLYREHLSTETAGLAEAFKVLSSMQLHFFPDAVRS